MGNLCLLSAGFTWFFADMNFFVSGNISTERVSLFSLDRWIRHNIFPQEPYIPLKIGEISMVNEIKRVQ